jgi:hypothetical protein
MSDIWTMLHAGAQTVVRMFVADRGLALSVLAWVALAAASVPMVVVPRPWEGPVFTAGLMVMLVHSVGRAARARR